MTSTHAPWQMPGTQRSRTEVTIMNSWTSAEWDAVAERSLTHDPARPAPVPAPAGTAGLAIALALVGAACAGKRKYRPGHGHARRRSLRLTRRPSASASASVSREPGSRTRIPDRWLSCHARHCAGRRGGERSAAEIFKVTPEIAEYQQRFSRLISHRVPFCGAGRAFQLAQTSGAAEKFAAAPGSLATPAWPAPAAGSPALCPGDPGRHRLAATGRGRTGSRMAGNPEDSDADDATRISRRFPRVPAQDSIDNARGVARPLPNGRGSDAGAGRGTRAAGA